MNEYEETLWVSARNSKRPREALEELAKVAFEKRDAQQLLTIYSRLLELDPNDVAARKGWSRVAFLLGTERFRAGTMAQEVAQQFPTDPEAAATYALVLHVRSQDAEALKVLSRLKPEQLRDPAIAGYYGMVLVGNRRQTEAAEYLALAKNARFFHQEEELMDHARSALDVPLPKR
jgi:hypothetical protein